MLCGIGRNQAATAAPTATSVIRNMTNIGHRAGLLNATGAGRSPRTRRRRSQRISSGTWRRWVASRRRFRHEAMVSLISVAGIQLSGGRRETV